MYRESYFEKIFVIAKTNVAITMSGKCFTLPSIPLYAPILAYNQGYWTAFAASTILIPIVSITN